MKNFSIMGVHLKIWFLEEGSQKTIYRGEFPEGGKEGSLDSFQI